LSVNFLPVKATLSALMTMTLSPSSTCGVKVGDDGGETADDETLGVDQHPLLHHVRRFLRKGCHGSAFCWTFGPMMGS
jgi:hypothetical protein